MEKAKNLGTVELRGSRIYLKYRTKMIETEFDVTPLWHFFKEVDAYIKEPKGTRKKRGPQITPMPTPTPYIEEENKSPKQGERRTEQCFCQSYFDDNNELKDCTCGECFKEAYDRKIEHNCKIDSHIPSEEGEVCECGYFRKAVSDDYCRYVRDMVSDFRNFKNDVRQITIEDVPHQYQERLLEIVKVFTRIEPPTSPKNLK